VIAVFTKFDQFKRNIQIRLEDEGRAQQTNLNKEVEAIYLYHYKRHLGETSSLIVRLESEDFSLSCNSHCANLRPAEMHVPGQKCTELIEATARALSRDVVGLMLLAVQKDNLELSIRQAVNR
jgi:hypothetical protein